MFIPIVISAVGTDIKGLLKGLGGRRMSGDHPNYYIIESDQNTEKSPGDLLSLKLQRKSIS